jgi:S-adenosylmethionine:tRNA ribosyltransferase-isomerase
MTAGTALPERYAYDLPEALEASEPPEARGLTRDSVRMLVSYKDTGSIVPSSFVFLSRFLDPGDLVVAGGTRCGGR